MKVVTRLLLGHLRWLLTVSRVVKVVAILFARLIMLVVMLVTGLQLWK